MLINRKYQIEAATAPDDTRPVLTAVCIAKIPVPNVLTGETEDIGVAIAADGFIMAVVPVTLEEGDVRGLVPGKHFVEAYKGSPKRQLEVKLALEQEFTRDSTGTLRKRDMEGTYPDFFRIVPKAEPLDIEQYQAKARKGGVIAIDLSYLARLAKALGDTRLVLQPTTTGDTIGGPIIVKVLSDLLNANWTVPPFGLIMPLGLGDFRLNAPVVISTKTAA